jgi:magnesium chelatase family protein
VPTLRYQELASKDVGEPSLQIRQRVNAARAIQLKRFDKEHPCQCPGSGPRSQTALRCDGAEKLLEHALNKLGLSARAYSRVLKLSAPSPSRRTGWDSTEPHRRSDSVSSWARQMSVERLNL